MIRREGHYRQSSLRRSASALHLARGVWPALRWADALVVVLALYVAAACVLWVDQRGGRASKTRIACPRGTRTAGGKPPAHHYAWCEVASKRTWRGGTDAVKHGPFVAYYDSGAPRQLGRYALGRKVGYWVTFAPDGTHTTVHTFDDRGQLREMTVYGKSYRSWDAQGRAHGEWVDQGPEGKALRMRRYLLGKPHGRWQRNDSSGRIVRLEHYDRGERHGKHAAWHEGRLIARGYFTHGRKSGTWERWSEDGKFESAEHYGGGEQLVEPSPR